MTEGLRICIATGTRADWGLLVPLAREFRRQGTEPTVLATYSHLFPEMGHTIEEIVADGFNPVEIPARMDRIGAVADTVEGFAEYFRNAKPDYVIILGDRFEMLGVASAALLTGVKIAHIAGGTTSLGAIDDPIRHSISKMATLHFPETKRGKEKLVLMGEDPEAITIAGALGVYNTMHTEMMTVGELGENLKFELGKRYAVGTYHPSTVSETSPQTQIQIWIDGMELAMQNVPDLKYLLTYPNSDTPPEPLISLLENFRSRYPERVYLCASLGRIRYLSAANGATAVIGNSSSGIVEVPSTGTPVLDIGHRQKGRERSRAVIHCDLTKEEIGRAIEYAVSPEAKQRALTTPNPYFKEDTPALIAERIIR